MCGVRYACRTVVGVSLVALHAEAAAEQQDVCVCVCVM